MRDKLLMCLYAKGCSLPPYIDGYSTKHLMSIVINCMYDGAFTYYYDKYDSTYWNLDLKTVLSLLPPSITEIDKMAWVLGGIDE